MDITLRKLANGEFVKVSETILENLKRNVEFSKRFEIVNEIETVSNSEVSNEPQVEAFQTEIIEPKAKTSTVSKPKKKTKK